MQPATVSTTSSSEQEEPLYPDNKPDGNDVADDMSDDEAYRPGRVISWATHVRNANAPPFERPYSPASQMSELSIKPRGTDLQKHRLLMVVLGCAMVANENGAARWDKLYDYIADLKPADMVQAIADTDNRAVISKHRRPVKPAGCLSDEDRRPSSCHDRHARDHGGAVSWEQDLAFQDDTPRCKVPD